MAQNGFVFMVPGEEWSEHEQEIRHRTLGGDPNFRGTWDFEGAAGGGFVNLLLTAFKGVADAHDE